MSDTFFKVFAPVNAFEKAGGEHPMRIGGICTTERLDRQGEKIVQKGLDFTTFLAEGWFNDNHGQSTTDVVGYPEDARYVQKGEQLPDGNVAEEPGWWVEGYLTGAKGEQIWKLAHSLQKSPRRLGFSIEGSVMKREGKSGRTISKARVRNVAITHCPVAHGTHLVALAKALTAGAAVGSADVSSGKPGDGGPLRPESLEGGPASSQEGEDEDEMVIDLDDLLKAESAASGPESITIVDHVKEWADAMSSTPVTEPERLTKSQAFDYITTARPDLTPDQVHEIIQRSEGGSP